MDFWLFLRSFQFQPIRDKNYQWLTCFCFIKIKWGLFLEDLSRIFCRKIQIIWTSPNQEQELTNVVFLSRTIGNEELCGWSHNTFTVLHYTISHSPLPHTPFPKTIYGLFLSFNHYICCTIKVYKYFIALLIRNVDRVVKTRKRTPTQEQTKEKNSLLIMI